MIYGIVIGVLFLGSYIAGFNQGIKMNKQEAKEIKVPNPITETVKAVNRTKADIRQMELEKEMAEGLNNIMHYTGQPQGGVK